MHTKQQCYRKSKYELCIVKTFLEIRTLSETDEQMQIKATICIV